MELEELNELDDLNELDLLYKVDDIIQSLKKDTEKILRGNNEASIRVRKGLQDVRLICSIMRDKIQDRRGAKRKENRTSALERAKQIAEQSRIKDQALIEKRKKERLARLGLT